MAHFVKKYQYIEKFNNICISDGHLVGQQNKVPCSLYVRYIYMMKYKTWSNVNVIQWSNILPHIYT